MKKSEKDFIQGFAVLAAFICEQGGAVNLENMFNEHGMTWEDLIEAGVEKYDLDRIKKHINMDKIRKKKKK